MICVCVFNEMNTKFEIKTNILYLSFKKKNIYISYKIGAGEAKERVISLQREESSHLTG